MKAGSRAWARAASSLIAVASLLVVGAEPAAAAYLRDVPQELVQPDGSVVRCFASGDEHYHWLHDADGYVIVKDPESGFWVWASKESGQIVATEHVVGRVPPDILGLEPRIFPDREAVKSYSALFAAPAAQSAPTTGAINNLVIFIRFSDDSEFTESTSTFEPKFNDTGSGESSLKSYFREVSSDQLTIDSTFYPTPPGSTVVSYQDAQPRNYYRPYNETTNPIGYNSASERTTREHTLLKNAVNAVASQVPAGLDIDSDDDGAVDSVVFIIKGGPDGWSDLLWPHRWVLYTQTAMINGAQVWDYNFQLSSWLEVGVLCHEMFHTLGAPDLYHYDADYGHLSPVGHWDLMEHTTDPPQHMLMHMKARYGGWVASIPEITTSGTYTLNPSTAATNNAYRIASPYSADEYFVLEYRRKTGTFEGSVPGSGLIVYRIDATLEGNAGGPPDEVYVYRPGGTTTVNGTPDSAFFTLDAGRTEINDSTNPSSFLADGSPGGLVISDVTSAGDTISFDVTIDADHFSLTLEPGSQQVCKGQNASFTVTLGQYGDFTGPVNLVATNRPVGSTASFSPNPVATVPGTSTLTIGTVSASLGTSTVEVTGTGTPGTRTDSAQLTLITVPGSPGPQSPADGAVNVGLDPTFAWTSAAGATSYTIEIDDEPSFVGLVHSASVAATSYSGANLDPAATYYWRVRASNTCGPGPASAAAGFTTSDGSTVCSNILLEPGFEGGPDSAWSESSSNDWVLVTADFPRTGTYSAWLGGDDDELSRVWQSPEIPAEATSATLTYWYAIGSNDVCGWDFGGVEVNGAPLAGHTYNLCTANNTGWVLSSTADLLAHAGTTPQIRFFADNDSSASSNLFIDDVVLEVCVPGSDPDAIFSDGFESADASGWSSVSQ